MDWICGRCCTRLAGETAGVCPACGGEDVIPVGSPRGAQLVAASAPQPVQPTPLFGPATAQPMPLPPLNPGVSICPACHVAGTPRDTGPNSMAQLFLIAMAIVGFVFFWPAGALLLLVIVIYSVQPARKVCGHCGEVLSGRR